MSAHRALPLDVVEARQRAARVSWGMTCPTCNTGTPGNCDCMPREAGSAVSELLRDPVPPMPPAYPWREFGAGLLVILVALAGVHVIATIYEAATVVAQR